MANWRAALAKKAIPWLFVDGTLQPLEQQASQF
jgi:hypothetical protein